MYYLAYTQRTRKNKAILETHDGGEDTGGLNNVVGRGSSPLDGGRVSLAVDGDGLAVNDELTVLDLDGTLEDTVGRVVP